MVELSNSKNAIAKCFLPVPFDSINPLIERRLKHIYLKIANECLNRIRKLKKNKRLLNGKDFGLLKEDTIV